MPTKKRIFVSRRLLLMVAMLVSVGAAAHAADRVNLSQGYSADNSAVVGSLVQIDHSATNKVKLATADGADDLVGVVVQTNGPLLSLSSGTNQVQVASTGVVTIIASDVSGVIKQGDRVTASPIAGVAMKASGSGRILGYAQSDFTESADKQTVQASKDGKTQTVKLGSVSVQLELSYYTVADGQAANFVPPIVQALSNTVAGKPVSPVRTIAAFILILVALLISIVLVYSAVRSSIVSIGRNPLSRSAVRNSLLQVFGFVFGILLVTLISVYFILSR